MGNKKRVMELKEVKALQQRENERERASTNCKKKNEIIIMGADLCGGGGQRRQAWGCLVMSTPI